MFRFCLYSSIVVQSTVASHTLKICCYKCAKDSTMCVLSVGWLVVICSGNGWAPVAISIVRGVVGAAPFKHTTRCQYFKKISTHSSHLCLINHYVSIESTLNRYFFWPASSLASCWFLATPSRLARFNTPYQPHSKRLTPFVRRTMGQHTPATFEEAHTICQANDDKLPSVSRQRQNDILSN